MVDPTGLDGACLYTANQCNPQGPTIGKVLVDGAKKVLDAGSQITGAIGDFVKNNSEMRDENRKGADKAYHCKANCTASSRGEAGEQVAKTLSDRREDYGQLKGDPPQDEVEDQAANRTGRDAGRSLRDSISNEGYRERMCRSACQPLRPRDPENPKNPLPFPR
jgi:hypothetical protein